MHIVHLQLPGHSICLDRERADTAESGTPRTQTTIHIQCTIYHHQFLYRKIARIVQGGVIHLHFCQFRISSQIQHASQYMKNTAGIHCTGKTLRTRPLLDHRQRPEYIPVE